MSLFPSVLHSQLDVEEATGDVTCAKGVQGTLLNSPSCAGASELAMNMSRRIESYGSDDPRQANGSTLHPGVESGCAVLGGLECGARIGRARRDGVCCDADAWLMVLWRGAKGDALTVAILGRVTAVGGRPSGSTPDLAPDAWKTNETRRHFVVNSVIPTNAQSLIASPTW